MSGIVKNVTATVGTVSRTADQTIRFKQISAGDDHSLGIGSDGNTYTWGWNVYGQLGDGTTTDKSTPVMVKAPAGVTFTQVSAGGSHSLAIGSDGNTYAWGRNNNGQLGDGTTTSRYTPVRVKAPAGVTFTQVSASGVHSLAIGSDGNTYAWGWNDKGRLGDGTTTNRYTPVMVKAPAGVIFTQLITNGAYSIALGSDGNTYAWGWNQYGQLGDGTTTDKSTPVMVKAPAGVAFTQVSAGGWSSLAIGSDGNTYTWGGDDCNFKDTPTTSRSMPVMVKVPAGVTFTQVHAGDDHSLALGSDGNTYAWGSNGYGQLGDGTLTTSPTPVGIHASTPGVSVDPTAVPVDPVGITETDGDTVRVYNLPFTVAPGGYVVYHFTGTVDRDKTDQIIHNQAWFNSPDTPYAVLSGGKVTEGVPHALGRTATTPDKPDDTKLDANSHDITGNASCMTGSDYDKQEMENWFSIRAEDQCDQVGAVIPAYTTTPTLGSISGLYWRDANRDGIRQDDETERIGGQQVILEDANGNQLATTTTKTDGTYLFDKLKLGTYRIRFSRVRYADFTKTDANDTDARNDTSSNDSDAGTGDDYGRGTPVITLKAEKTDWKNIDAGILSDTPVTNMPLTGTNAGLILLLMLATVVAARIAAGRHSTNNPNA